MNVPERCISIWPPLSSQRAKQVVCGNCACLMMEKMAGHSHYCLWVTAHPQLADMPSMAAAFPHITGQLRTWESRENLPWLSTTCTFSPSAWFQVPCFHASCDREFTSSVDP